MLGSRGWPAAAGSRRCSSLVGRRARLTKRFTADDLRQFAAISLDSNEIHLDKPAAQAAGFDRQIVHGILVNGLVSAVFGTLLPGKGSILCSQTIRFTRPLYVDEPVVAEVRVDSVRRLVDRHYLDCSFRAFVARPAGAPQEAGGEPAEEAEEAEKIVLRGTAMLLRREPRSGSEPAS